MPAARSRAAPPSRQREHPGPARRKHACVSDAGALDDALRAAPAPRFIGGPTTPRLRARDDRSATAPRQSPVDAGRVLVTILFTDIVDSTVTVARIGDHRWADLLAGHYADCRAEVAHRGGRVVGTTGDGMLATFDAPSCAIGAGMAVRAAARRRGLGVRAGVHTGECERLADGIAGLAVHIAARVCALADADEVITTRTVRDLVVGSMLAFHPRGVRLLKGVPGEWAVFSASAQA